MQIAETKYVLKNGQTVLIRSASVSDAGQIKEHREITSAETHYMAREPEDGPFNAKKIEENLLNTLESKNDFTITAFLDGKVIGDLGVTCIRPHIKYLHRAYLGMSIRQQYCNMGLGSYMLQLAVEQAKQNGFEQIELGVYEDNERAIHAYEKAGFKEVGRMPHAFKLPDGTYQSEIMMVRSLL